LATSRRGGCSCLVTVVCSWLCRTGRLYHTMAARYKPPVTGRRVTIEPIEVMFRPWPWELALSICVSY
jgi:hypothetical protein